jgi:predicted TIM-barrel fold metal-dependent hydrolase
MPPPPDGPGAPGAQAAVRSETAGDVDWRPAGGIIDTLMDVRPLPMQAGRSSVGHLFKHAILRPEDEDRVGAELLLPHMDRHGIAQALIEFTPDDQAAVAAVTEHPDRFLAAYTIDPNRGVQAIRELRAAVATYGVRAVSLIPAFYQPPVPIDDRRAYPIYAACEELNLPVFMTCGVPGPAVACEPQEVVRLDAVCHFFPTLKIVMRHGGLPWVDLAIALIAKWPNLYYSTSAMAPKHYPRAIIDFANRRAPDRVIYAGYFPRGLSLDRIVAELPELPFAPEVWPRFLAGNARHVLGLDQPAK